MGISLEEKLKNY